MKELNSPRVPGAVDTPTPISSSPYGVENENGDTAGNISEKAKTPFQQIINSDNTTSETIQRHSTETGLQEMEAADTTSLLLEPDALKTITTAPGTPVPIETASSGADSEDTVNVNEEETPFQRIVNNDALTPEPIQRFTAENTRDEMDTAPGFQSEREQPFTGKPVREKPGTNG
ncbi:MAG: hypothetical protein GY940_30745, partial [bacterium]|nr:hypothetical protein [bacterium]